MLFELSSMTETQAAVLSAVFGGAGVKLLEKLLMHRSNAFDESESMRVELRAQLEASRKELEEWKTEANDWREKYWAQVELNLELQQSNLQMNHTTASGSL